MCVCVCVGGWVCGCVGVWVCGCVGVELPGVRWLPFYSLAAPARRLIQTLNKRVRSLESQWVAEYGFPSTHTIAVLGQVCVVIFYTERADYEGKRRALFAQGWDEGKASKVSKQTKKKDPQNTHTLAYTHTLTLAHTHTLSVQAKGTIR